MPNDESTGNEQDEAGRGESSTREAAVAGGDPGEAVADTLRHASAALGDGEHDVASRRYGLVGMMAYRVSYGLSYAVLYPALLVARMVPRENALVHGLIDGAAAARDEAPKLGWSSTLPGSEGEQPATAPLPA